MRREAGGAYHPGPREMCIAWEDCRRRSWKQAVRICLHVCLVTISLIELTRVQQSVNSEGKKLSRDMLAYGESLLSVCLQS
jgi:hypothetical protein